jgi:hypothetical protein
VHRDHQAVETPPVVLVALAPGIFLEQWLADAPPEPSLLEHDDALLLNAAESLPNQYFGVSSQTSDVPELAVPL